MSCATETWLVGAVLDPIGRVRSCWLLRECVHTIILAHHLSESLIHAKLFKEARTLLRKNIRVARRTRENGNEVILDLRTTYVRAIYRDTNSSRSDVHEAVAISEDIVRTARRVFGTEHPYFAGYQADLESARMRLADDESRAADA